MKSFVISEDSKNNVSETFHDCYVTMANYDCVSRALALTMENPFFDYRGEFAAKDVIYLEMSKFDMWGSNAKEKMRIIDFVIEEDERIEALVYQQFAKNGLEGEGFSEKKFPKYIYVTFWLVSGDRIRIVAKEYVWKNERKMNK